MIYEKSKLKASLQFLSTRITDALTSTHCPSCHELTVQNHALCKSCYHEMPWIIGDCCQYCGTPVKGAIDPICLDCWNHPRVWDQGFATARYEGIAKKMVLSLKNGKSEKKALTIAKLMVNKHRTEFEKVDLITAMPLHWRRQLSRGFNQAALIAYHISKETQKPFLPHALKRERYTPKQGKGRDFQARFENLSNAISTSRSAHCALDNKNVALIDDVMTSGASLQECAKALKLGGAKTVTIFVFTRAAIHD